MKKKVLIDPNFEFFPKKTIIYFNMNLKKTGLFM